MEALRPPGGPGALLNLSLQLKESMSSLRTGPPLTRRAGGPGSLKIPGVAAGASLSLFRVDG